MFSRQVLFFRRGHAGVGAILCGGLCVVAAISGPGATTGWEAPPEQQKEGAFWRYHWYERGLTNASFGYDKRFRINSPEVVLHPEFGRRIEARENGLMLIQAEENLFQLTGAELYLEMWGGHPGTANKRVTINGRNTYYLPRVGAEDGHCTYSYPVIPLKISDLVNGYDACQFALDQGTTFWGHGIIDNGLLRAALTNNHPDLASAGLTGFRATVKVEPLVSGEGYQLTLDGPPGPIVSVAFQGWYYGYDDNGNRQGLDWHGFTKNRAPVAWLGEALAAPFTATWDTSMLPAQKNMAVRAVVRFSSATNVVYLTAARRGLAIAERPASQVGLFAPHDLPGHFWSRARELKTCSLDLDLDPTRIEKAELHVITWTGGPGTVQEYFKLNGVHYPVADGARHELMYSRLPVDPRKLQRGLNRIELLSDTEHHGIEVAYPGPALIVRWRR